MLPFKHISTQDGDRSENSHSWAQNTIVPIPRLWRIRHDRDGVIPEWRFQCRRYGSRESMFLYMVIAERMFTVVIDHRTARRH